MSVGLGACWEGGTRARARARPCPAPLRSLTSPLPTLLLARSWGPMPIMIWLAIIIEVAKGILTNEGA